MLKKVLILILLIIILPSCDSGKEKTPDYNSLKTKPGTVYKYDFTKIGIVRLTVDAKWKMWNHGYDWHYSTLVEYLDEKNNLWEYVTQTEYNRNYTLQKIDAYAFGKQILLTNLRPANETSTEKGTVYIRNSRDRSWAKFELTFQNPQRLAWYFNPKEKRYDRYTLTMTGSKYNQEYWNALQKDMDLEERCWYFNKAHAREYIFTPQKKEIDVVHLMKTPRVIKLRVLEGNPPGIISISESAEHFVPMPLSPLEDRTKRPNNAFNLVDPQVQNDLIRNDHPCASYYEEHHLIAPKDNFRKGFLYPSF